ncbi:MAG: SGNH/GDSL hydrolase family protein [Phycisphaerae bacterium]
MVRRHVFGVVVGLALLANVAHAGEGTVIVAFGDSLSDMGNRWLDTKKPDIKFRRTWVAQLAEPGMLDSPGFKPSGITSFYGGTNYAVGGAGTAATANMGLARNRGQDLTQQVSKRYLNPEFNKAGVQAGALHVIVIGSNDVVAASAEPAQILLGWDGLDAMAAAVAKSTEGQIDALAKAGAKRVMWGNVFDVSRAPAMRTRAKTLLPEAVAPTYLAAIAKAVRAHNAEMDAAIGRLTKAHPGLEVVKLDLFAKFEEMSADPSKFGLADVTTGANDEKHLFSADGLHPTPKGHKLIAEFAFEVVKKGK